jgi:hypothetical protein
MAGMLMMEKNRRTHPRLSLRLDVVCQKVGQGTCICTGNTVNVSPSGMLLEVNTAQRNEGELVSVEMCVPPTEGLLEFGGRFDTYARVVRSDLEAETHRRFTACGRRVALEFCQSPKLRV